MALWGKTRHIVTQWRGPLQQSMRQITLLTTFNVVDNSEQGKSTNRHKKPYLIGFYGANNVTKTADIGDVVCVAARGKPCKALIVGTRKSKNKMIPRFDNNNIVMIDDNFAPLGTRIKGPLPTILRKQKDKYAKILALATRFV